ncbi:Rec8 like protein-domain-containing protein [Cadophora sp. MPI-SDFR-AT-0126]|nr:Rec8 like protein-domain-containing protein [Leotiomycetes sp. MPI-SDFR-AT-0126]
MFYSHEILTSRKYGVATIWLVATLGAKSNTKKVTKKAILDVNVKKACETIIEPEAPMALRLQSNLLYGVSKVYNQQWEYLLLDTQTAQNTMRTLIKIARSTELDATAMKAHPDQLIMMDDPAFAIDMPAPPLDFDFTNMELNPKGDSQRSSQSMLSIRGRSGSVVSQASASSILGFNIPSSNGGSYQLPLLDPFGDSSGQKPLGTGPGMFNDEEDLILQDDDLFGFDADGQLRDIPMSERNTRRQLSINPQHRLGSDSVAIGCVRKEHKDAFVGRIQGVDGDDGFDMPLYDEEMPVLPDVEPFPLMTGGLGGGDRPLHLSDEDRVMSASDESSVSAEAPQRRKKKVKGPVVDASTEIRNAVLSQWIKEYPENMTASARIKIKHRAATQAKKNAFYYVYGSGLNGAGDCIGAGKFANPLAIFSGIELMAKITGTPIPEVISKKRTKRALAADEEDEEETPNKRAREGEVGRGNNEDDMMFNLEDDQYPHSHEKSVEVGRDAASALADHPPSAMPWNISSSLHSHQRGHSSSIQGRVGILGSQVGSVTGRRLTSPLVGRGSTIPGDLEQFSQLMDDDMVMYGREDDGLGSASQASGFHAGGMRTSSQTGGGDDFEIFGAAAGVDTQTAGSSQWMKDVMDRESNNFFEYVKNTIEEKSTDELGDEDDAEPQQKTVTFEELFVPEKNSCIVAAQAFYHILSLATKRKIWVEQDIDDEMLSPFGEIRIGVV